MSTKEFSDKALNINTNGKAIAFKLNLKANPNYYDSVIELLWATDVSLPDVLPNNLKVLSANQVKEIPVLPESVVELECFSARLINSKITNKFKRIYYNKELLVNPISTFGINTVMSEL